jgi:2-polyprenyl-3-methyl-5-hydroxy-6-metoxy-1,4-benzoquinol methylase
MPVPRLARAWATFRKVHASGAEGPGPQHRPTEEEVGGWAQAIRAAVAADVIRFDRCAGCGLEVASPGRPWPEGAYPKDEHYPVRWEFDRFLADLAGARHEAGAPNSLLLELGCGAGQFLERARAEGHQPLGIDFNPAAIDEARRRGLEVVLGGFEQLRSHLSARGPERSFGAVAMFHVIEHLPEPAGLLNGLAEFVRPGTLLGLSCPGPNRFTRLIRAQQAGRRDWWDYPPHHVLRWTTPALSTFLQANGWELVRAEEEPFSLVHAAAQMGYTQALWNGFAHRRWWTRWAILAARLRLLTSFSRYRGLSLYALARWRG